MEGVKPMRGEIVPGKDFEEKGIYVLGSGMMVEKTPSYLAAAAIMEERSNAIFFVGYAACVHCRTEITSLLGIWLM